MNIGLNIYTLRKEKRITQAQLAEKLGVSEQAISKWENGQCAPDVSLFPVMAEFFGVSIDRLFGYHRNSYADEVKAIIPVHLHHYYWYFDAGSAGRRIRGSVLL